MPLHESQAKPNGPIPQAVPRTTPATAGDAEEREIPLAATDSDSEQTRKEFDPERHEELKASLHDHGLLYAIVVFLVLATGRYQIVDGERRWRAAKALGWTTIRARVLREPPDNLKLRELRLIGNEQRQDFSDLERGLAYQDFLSSTGCTASALAHKIGKSVSTVTRAIALIRKLPEDLRQIVGPQLPPSVAQLLTALPDDDAKRHFAGLYRDGQIKSGDELAAAIKAAKNGQAAGGMAGSFTCEEEGCKIAVALPPGGNLAAAETALRIVLKDLKDQAHRGLDHWKTFLAKKKAHAKKAEELATAQKALARHAGSDGKAGA